MATNGEQPGTTCVWSRADLTCTDNGEMATDGEMPLTALLSRVELDNA